MLIGIWNMEWASPGTAESGAAQSQVEGLGFDVFVGNEVTPGALHPDPNVGGWSRTGKRCRKHWSYTA